MLKSEAAKSVQISRTPFEQNIAEPKIEDQCSEALAQTKFGVVVLNLFYFLSFFPQVLRLKMCSQAQNLTAARINDAT